MTINHSGQEAASVRSSTKASSDKTTVASKPRYVQSPIAIVGMACRLPGESNTPGALWDFLKRGGVATNEAPESRFNLKTHHDGSKKPKTMRSPGGYWMESINPRTFDAQFFNISRTDAIAMDPQQRQLLEVVYEGLENAGLRLEDLDGAPFGCFVGSYAVDYADMQARDPDDRAPSITVGVGRAILSNRISHFLNIKGPSMTVDTACSGSLVGVDLACRYLTTGEIDGAVVAGANIYLSPEHNMDGGAMKGASSLSGKCHTFDVKADGYIKAEAVNTVILKRLDDALRDGDPIRAIIRGSATNSDGRTPGIASPSSEAQAAAIRAAYANAGITDLSQTTYLECHGTGTQAGDPLEVAGVSSVFAPTRKLDQPLLIGSIKSNVGHSEPAAGISGLLKATLAVENGYIPGNPTFETPNPKIDFDTLKVRASRTGVRWPKGSVRRASVNSFGYGGSNAHVIVEDLATCSQNSARTYKSSYITDEDDFFAESTATRPYTLVFSANDEKSLRAYCQTISKHLLNPRVNVKLPELAYTLSERRSRHFHRAYIVTQNSRLQESAFIFGKRSTNTPKIGFVFTGQGAQWSQMGKSLIETFPLARNLLRHLDAVLQALPSPPPWSLTSELTEPRKPETLRLPEFSQPLVTALQLVLLAVLNSWGVFPQAVVGHSSGEIAAAYSAGLITREEAIKIAYFRGQAATECHNDDTEPVGMLAVGLGADQVAPYLKGVEHLVQIGCYNSPSSVTLSGNLKELENVKARLDEDHHFARLLQVNLAYHSKYMAEIGERYEELLLQNCEAPPQGSPEKPTMFSSVTGERLSETCDARYWKNNAINPVRFHQATHAMLSAADSVDFLIELGPSGALAGPIAQIKKALPSQGTGIQYFAASSRGKDALNATFNVAGQLFISGGSIDMASVNTADPTTVKDKHLTIVDLPNYVWNHSSEYWHESESSKDWRYRNFPHHDLLGSKVLGTPWDSPSWKKTLRLEDLPWLRDHKMGAEVVFPGAGYIAMATEAIYQVTFAKGDTEQTVVSGKHRYRLRNVVFPKALVLEEGKESKIMLTIVPRPGTKDSWHDFKVMSSTDDVWSEHSRGLVRLEQYVEAAMPERASSPLTHATHGQLWYKAMYDAGYNFGPAFQKQLQVESASGTRQSRSLVSLTEPESEYPQSPYAMHPACIDGCMQTAAPSLWQGERSSVNAVLVPAIIDDLVIQGQEMPGTSGLSVSTSKYVGLGRPEETKNYMSDVTVYDRETKALLFQLSGLRYHKLDTREDVHAAHKYSRVTWKEDITFLTSDKLARLSVEPVPSRDRLPAKVDQMMQLMVHKKPNLRIKEINMLAGDSSSVWLDETSLEGSTKAACDQYRLIVSDASTMLEAQEKFEAQPDVEFDVHDYTKASMGNKDGAAADADLIILRHGHLAPDLLEQVASRVRDELSESGYLLLLEISGTSQSIETNHVNHQISSCQHPSGSLHAAGFVDTYMVPSRELTHTYQSASLSFNKAKLEASSVAMHRLEIVNFSENTSRCGKLEERLSAMGWQITQYDIAQFQELPTGSLVLVTEELYSPTLKNINQDQWQALKSLISSSSRILWLTAGSQFKVTNPDDALIHGLARTVRAEDPSVNLTTLDVESSKGESTLWATDRILRTLLDSPRKKYIESEYVERNGMIYTSRIMPDDLMNEAGKADADGQEPRVMDLHAASTTVRSQCERVGTIDSVRYAEVSSSELPLRDGCVEVEIAAAGVNFKDIAVTMGIVPENQHLLGLEGAGTIRRLGASINNLKIGQRVMVFEKGTFANRIIATTERVYPLPDTLSYEDASTMPSVYLTSIYSIFDLANTRKGHRVLIHSASGGVGIACIQLCQYIGAEIFATVGTQEKRDFLVKNFGIPAQNIFSSRSIAFASSLKQATSGQGVDVIINSLTGDLLDESWRCIANGGTMVEIGKKDMLDRNSLSMEPFGRNATYRGFDMSHKHVSDALIARLLDQMMSLLAAGHIKPIAPIKTFEFEDIASAFRYMRGGNHIGKIVISSPSSQIEVSARPAPRELVLSQEKSYLIVGGLKGLCGSLAIYLARLGIRHLVILARSGYADEKSRSVLKDIYALGCTVDLIKGDVSVLADVERTFESASYPIAGVIQGAMVLRDKIFTSMTVDEYHQTTESKVQGTWNLHNVSLAHPTPLSFFTMLSSISGVVGQKGQANYAAGNVFLDNFAAYRQQLGLAACSVDLGAIEDVGYMSQHSDLVVALDTSAWTPINESLFHKIMRFSLLQQQPQPINPASTTQLITSIAIPQKENSILLADARFGPLHFKDGSGSQSTDKSKEGSREIQAFLLLLRSSQADKSAILAAAVDIVNRQFTVSLRLSEPMEPAKPLASYGLDSLGAVEFRNWVRMELGAELTTLEITNASSLFALCEKIVAKITPTEST